MIGEGLAGVAKVILTVTDSNDNAPEFDPTAVSAFRFGNGVFTNPSPLSQLINPIKVSVRGGSVHLGLGGFSIYQVGNKNADAEL